MSYEGREQIICKKGHYYTQAATYGETRTTCPICQAEPAWVNSVDDTNLDSYGVIPEDELKKFLVKADEICTCKCGHQHVSAPAVYRVPSQEETILARHHWNGTEEVRIPIIVPKKGK